MPGSTATCLWQCSPPIAFHRRSRYPPHSATHWRDTPGSARSRKSNPPLFPKPAQPFRYSQRKPPKQRRIIKSPGSRAKPSTGASVEPKTLASNRSPKLSDAAKYKPRTPPRAMLAGRFYLFLQSTRLPAPHGLALTEEAIPLLMPAAERLANQGCLLFSDHP